MLILPSQHNCANSSEYWSVDWYQILMTDNELVIKAEAGVGGESCLWPPLVPLLQVSQEEHVASSNPPKHYFFYNAIY